MANVSSLIKVEYVECPPDRAFALRSAIDTLASVLDEMVAAEIGHAYFFCVEPSAVAHSSIGTVQTTALPFSAD